MTSSSHDSPRDSSHESASPFAEICPHCGSIVRLEDAYCLACGMSRGVSTSTPREDYLRACVAGLELLRQAHRRVHPIRETLAAEGLLETAINHIRSGCPL